MVRLLSIVKGRVDPHRAARRLPAGPTLCLCLLGQLRVGASYAEGVLASGNIVFDIDREVDDVFVGAIEAALRASLRFEIPTIVRSGDELRAVQRALIGSLLGSSPTSRPW